MLHNVALGHGGRCQPGLHSDELEFTREKKAILEELIDHDMRLGFLRRGSLVVTTVSPISLPSNLSSLQTAPHPLTQPRLDVAEPLPYLHSRTTDRFGRKAPQPYGRRRYTRPTTRTTQVPDAAGMPASTPIPTRPYAHAHAPHTSDTHTLARPGQPCIASQIRSSLPPDNFSCDDTRTASPGDPRPHPCTLIPFRGCASAYSAPPTGLHPSGRKRWRIVFSPRQGRGWVFPPLMFTWQVADEGSGVPTVDWFSCRAPSGSVRRSVWTWCWGYKDTRRM
ncbi:hypothetical protein SVAN01_05141 [Stagonosporopsis vannaccii]|nr:hypothetical protein SVAN01_05141 [Stagonosporopsis vannaccii]